MKVLLDTHAFLWWIADNPKLSVRARRIVGDEENEIYFSVASGWELAIKRRLSLLRTGDDFETFIVRELATNRFKILPVELRHALRTSSLPCHHRDPFDRLLIAQSIVEEMPIVSFDSKFRRYGVRVLW